MKNSDNLVKDFKQLILLMHRYKVVESIAKSKGNLAVYEEKKAILSKEIKSFAEEAKQRVSDSGYAIRRGEYQIYPADAVQICFLSIMSGIYETDLVQDWEELELKLYKVKGSLKDTAIKLAKIMETTSLVSYDEEALFKKVF